MAFYIGQSVEVASKQEGFFGSYFPASIIAEQHDGSYVVKYKTLLEADESEPLVERVNSDEVRPRPIRIPATLFALNEYVDAFDNDGWWVGRIIRRIKGGYTVYFDISMVAVDYPFEKLRTHLEWCYDEWWLIEPLGFVVDLQKEGEEDEERRKINVYIYK